MAGKIIGGTTIVPVITANQDWSKAAATFTAIDTSLKATLNIRFEGTGKIDLDMISRFRRIPGKKDQAACGLI